MESERRHVQSQVVARAGYANASDTESLNQNQKHVPLAAKRKRAILKGSTIHDSGLY